MSSFYGQVFGAGKTPATRRGYNSIEVSAQSWNGSVQTRLWYSEDGTLMVDLSIAEGSSASGYRVFSGTMEEFRNIFKKS